MIDYATTTRLGLRVAERTEDVWGNMQALEAALDVPDENNVSDLQQLYADARDAIAQLRAAEAEVASLRTAMYEEARRAERALVKARSRALPS